MKKTKFTLLEAQNLNQEMNSLMQEETISFGVKYELMGSLEKVSKVVERFEKQRIEIFKKFGKQLEDTSYTLEGCEKIEEAVAELDELGKKEETFDFSKFHIEDFKNIKSKYPYRFIYRVF